MKSKRLKTYNLPSDSYYLSRIDAKPNYLFLIMLVFGTLLLFDQATRVYGIVLDTLSLILLILSPKVVLIEFYNDYLVLYNKAEKDACTLIYYDEVISWSYLWSTNHDYLNIELEDGSEERIEAFSKALFENYMNRYLKDKKKKNLQ